MKTPAGTTPPAPGLEREEPDLAEEDDIPTDDPSGSAVDDKPRSRPETDRPRTPAGG